MQQSDKIKKGDKKMDLSTLKSFKPISQIKESCYFGRPLTEVAPWGGGKSTHYCCGVYSVHCILYSV